MINSLDVGGAEKVLLSYIKALSTDNRYIINVMTNKSSESFIQKEMIKITKIYILEEIIKNKPKIFRSFFKNLAIKEIIKSNDIIIDFLDADFYKHIKFCHKPKITWLHSSYGNLCSRKKNMKARLFYYDHIVTICEDMKREVDEKIPVLSSKVSLIYNPFDFESIRDKAINISSLSDEEREILNKPFYLSVSRIDEAHKDFDTLIRSYKNAINKYSITQSLIILGDGPDLNKLKKLTLDLNIDKNVIFMGMKENPYIWMKHSEKFILSSKGEGLPTVLIEALSLDCNIISSDCKVGPSEILDKGRLGYLFSTGDIETLTSLFLVDKKSFNINIEIDKFTKESSLKKFHSMINKHEHN
ncbi:glycosyltransferase [Aeromonas enteropelogenes]|uniref:glycosyltransferase n=1 Tax=Aeromonas enteropelogenes TaxID=29489 RepID=UPI003989FCC2